MQSLDPLNTSSSGPGQGATSAASSSPASRQKSCNACVRGKRRCDKTAPRCTRCAAKGLECVYQRVPPGSSPSSVTLAGSSARPSDAGLASASAMSSTDMSDDFEMGGFDVSDLGSGYSTSHSAATATTTTTTSPDSLTLDPNLDFSIADLLNGAHHSVMGDDGGVSSGSLSSLWSLPGFTEPKADFPSLIMQPQSYMQPQRTTIRDLSLFEECQMTRKCVSMDPLLIHDPRSSIGFMFQYMSNMHVDFVQTRSLPFSHPRLYSTQVPKTMMAAFCAAATYAARTPSTKAWAVKAVQDAANAVHSEGATATTPLEKLARCQALLVIDSIRIFDGDLGMRYAAERGLHILQKWAEELVQVVHELSGVTSDDELPKRMGKDHLPPTWDTWILHESARRSAMISLAFQCFFYLMRSEAPDPEIMAKLIPYTASRHLWNATSSVDFYRAWREQPQWTIRSFDFKEFWMYARPEDLDEFTRIMLTAQCGPDAVEHFMQGDSAIPVV